MLKNGQAAFKPGCGRGLQVPQSEGRSPRKGIPRASGYVFDDECVPVGQTLGLVRQYFRFSPVFRYTVGGQFDTGQGRHVYRKKAPAPIVTTIGWTGAAWHVLWARSDARSFGESLAYRVGVPDRRRRRYGYGADIPFR